MHAEDRAEVRWRGDMIGAGGLKTAPPVESWLAVKSPEKMLAWCVLENAILDYLFEKRKPRWQQEAAEWIASDDTSYLYSFVNICCLLNLEPSSLRVSLLRQTKSLREGSRIQPTLRLL